MSAMERTPTSKPTMRYSFALANLAATQTGIAVPILGGVLNTYAMPKGGYVVGYSVCKSAATSAGNTDVDITIAGTSIKTIAVDTASTTVFTGEMPMPAHYFTAGAILGVTYTTDGDHAPTTQDIVVDVFVVLFDYNF